MIKKEIVKNLHISVGSICNNSCVFCMESDKINRFKSVNDFIKKRIWKALKENTYLSDVTFATGEPTLNPELVKYIKYAKKLKYKNISIISNGRQYKDRIFCLNLVEAGARKFIISCHGYNANLHDSLTRVPGSFVETLEGIRSISWLRARLPISLLISHVVNKKNYLYIERFLKLLQGFMIDEVILNTVQPRGGNMDRNFFELMPRYSEVAQVLEEIIEKRPELFISNVSQRQYLSIVDIPFCVSEKLNPLIGFGRINFVDKQKRIRPIATATHKTKRSECGACKYNNVCDGVYKKYSQHFGWDEFQPVKL